MAIGLASKMLPALDTLDLFLKNIEKSPASEDFRDQEGPSFTQLAIQTYTKHMCIYRFIFVRLVLQHHDIT